MAVVIKDRVCRQCGAVFQGGPRAWYCPECAYDAVREVDRPASRAWNQAHKDTYYPAKNAKRNAERAVNPELVRSKERAYRQKRRDSKKS